MFKKNINFYFFFLIFFIFRNFYIYKYLSKTIDMNKEIVNNYLYNYKVKHPIIYFLSLKDKENYFEIYDKPSKKIINGNKSNYFNINFERLSMDFLLINDKNLEEFKIKNFKELYSNNFSVNFKIKKEDNNYLTLNWDKKNCLGDKGNIYDFPGILARKNVKDYTFFLFCSQQNNELILNEKFKKNFKKAINGLDELITKIDLYS